MKLSSSGSDEIGMFGPETDLIISLAAVLILFITVEKKKTYDEIESVHQKQVVVMKNLSRLANVYIRDSVIENSAKLTLTIPIRMEGKITKSTITIENYDYRQKFTFGESALFKEGEYNLKEEGKHIVHRVFKEVAKSISAIEEVRIEGHADRTPLRNPNFKFGNMELASLRAMEVFQYLTQSTLISPESVLMSASSFGEYNPVGRNRKKEIRLAEYYHTPDSPLKHRRIEIVLTYSSRKD